MDRTLATTYHKFREHSPFMLVGENAAQALRSAKTLIAFRELEEQGKVRIKVEPEYENYFDVFGEPDDSKDRQRIIDQIERDGCWCVIVEYLERTECTIEDCACPFHRAPREMWETADSIGMCVGYNDPTDPFENAYIIGLMEEAIDQYRAQ
jgi:hypothetical protein